MGRSRDQVLQRAYNEWRQAKGEEEGGREGRETRKGGERGQKEEVEEGGEGEKKMEDEIRSGVSAWREETRKKVTREGNRNDTK